MNINSPEFLTMLVLGSLFCILVKITKINRDQTGKAIKCKKKTPLFIGVTIIIVVILLFVTSSGCTTKGQTTINNINNVSQTASEKTTATETSAEKVTSAEEIISAEETTTAEKETQAITPTTTTKPDIEIIHPVEKTSWKENIGGIAKNIPDNYELWILVYSHQKEQYYPYAKIVPQYDEWAIPVTIGFEDDYWNQFDIVAVLADKKAQDRFNTYLNTITENEENIYSQGIYLIPDGAKEYSRITLTRKGSF